MTNNARTIKTTSPKIWETPTATICMRQPAPLRRIDLTVTIERTGVTVTNTDKLSDDPYDWET